MSTVIGLEVAILTKKDDGPYRTLEERDDTNGYAGKNLPCDRQYLRTGQSDGFRVGTTARDRHPGVPGQAAWGSGPGRDQGSKPNGQLLFAWFASAWDRFYEVAGDPLNECGAVIMGRRSFEQIDSEQGWVFPDGTAPDWPVIVLQSHARASVKKGKTHFHFVTDGIQSAIAKAQELAGEKYVALHGASSVQQALKADLLDEFHLNIAPVLLGEGVRLFDHLGASPIQLERTRTLETPGATHLSFRVVK